MKNTVKSVKPEGMADILEWMRLVQLGAFSTNPKDKFQVKLATQACLEIVRIARESIAMAEAQK